jgi:hypothetical protein
MDATQRRVRYLMANRHVSEPTAAEIVRRAYASGTNDRELGFTAAQCLRLRHARGKGHYARQREAARTRRLRLARLWGG